MVPMKLKNRSDFVLVKEAAVIAGVCADTIRLWERSGRLAAIRAGGMRLFLRGDVQRIARERAARKAEAGK